MNTLIGLAASLAAAVGQADDDLPAIRLKNDTDTPVSIRLTASKDIGRPSKKIANHSGQKIKSGQDVLLYVRAIESLEFDLTSNGMSRSFSLISPFPKEDWTIKITDVWLPKRREPFKKVAVKLESELAQLFYDKGAELAIEGSPECQRATGLQLQQLGKAQDAIPYLLAASEHGEVLSQTSSLCELAIMYLRGEGVERDVEKGIEYLNLAIARGNADAMHGLSLLYANPAYSERDFSLSEKWLQRAAELDDLGANRRLLYREYRSYPNHPSSAADKRRKATALEKLSEIAGSYSVYGVFCESRNLYAFAVGEAYFKGYGVEQDYNKAIVKGFGSVNADDYPDVDLYIGDIYLQWSESNEANVGFRKQAIESYEKAKQAGVPGAAERIAAANRPTRTAPQWTEDDTEKAIVIGAVVVGALLFGNEMMKDRPASQGKQPPIIGKKFDELFHTTCRSCNGTGVYIGRQCRTCGGYGFVD
jgi:TPR repeat protein